MRRHWRKRLRAAGPPTSRRGRPLPLPRRPSPKRKRMTTSPRIDETHAFVPVRIAIMTVSDTRNPADDVSGDTLAARIADAGHVLAARALLRDEQALIAAQLRTWIADPGIDVVISTGGTGLTG